MKQEIKLQLVFGAYSLCCPIFNDACIIIEYYFSATLSNKDPIQCVNGIHYFKSRQALNGSLMM